MFYSLDRFVGDFAVMVDDNKNSFDISRKKIPPYAEPGMVFRRIKEGFFVYAPQETKERKSRIIDLQDELFL